MADLITIPTIEDVTRRTFITGALASALLIACGEEQDEDTDPTPTASSSFPVIIQHKYGSTRIDAAPQRVVIVGYTEHETCLALGVKPVGMFNWLQEEPRQKWPWVTAQWAGEVAPAIGVGGAGLELELIASLQPDLILGASQIDAVLTEELYGRLSQIAPTVAQPAEAGNRGVPWQQVARIVATSLGREEQAEQQIAAIEARFAAIRSAHPAWSTQTAVFLDAWQAPATYGVYAAADSRGQFLAQLGFLPDPEIEALMENNFSTRITQERTNLLDADWLFIIATAAKRQELANDPLFQQLPSVRADHVIWVASQEEPFIGAALSYHTILSLPYAIDRMEALIVAQE